MTFSIVASNGTDWGVAVASKFLAVGSAVPAATAGVGAIATQSYANLAYRSDGLALLRSGKTAQQALDALTDADALRAQRQAGVVDAHGNAATFTGDDCHPWAGGRAASQPPGAYAIQGNILAGEAVVVAMQDKWLQTDPTAPLARRLLAALEAGDDAGGDRRGRQSAALLVVRHGGGYGGGSDVAVDLRVDDNPAPIPELIRLLDLHDLYFTKADPSAALALEGDLADEVRRRLAQLGHETASQEGADLDAALADWAGVENFEERMVAGRIDPTVLEQLRAKTEPR